MPVEKNEPAEKAIQLHLRNHKDLAKSLSKFAEIAGPALLDGDVAEDMEDSAQVGLLGYQRASGIELAFLIGTTLHGVCVGVLTHLLIIGGTRVLKKAKAGTDGQADASEQAEPSNDSDNSPASQDEIPTKQIEPKALEIAIDQQLDLCFDELCKNAGLEPGDADKEAIREIAHEVIALDLVTRCRDSLFSTPSDQPQG